MNCKNNSSENLERQLGGKVAYIRELDVSGGQRGANSKEPKCLQQAT